MPPDGPNLGAEGTGKPRTGGYDAPAMSEPNTPQDPSSTPLWDAPEPGPEAPGLPSDATQPWDPSELPTSAVPSASADAPADAGAEIPDATSVDATATVVDAGAADAFPSPDPWSPAPAAPAMLASTALPGADGPARGVASGRPRTPEEPPVGRKTPAAAIVGSVIGLAIVVALGAWFLLLRPSGNTAVASPSASPITLSSPTPVATETTPPTAEPTDRSTPVPTPFKAPTFTGLTLEQARALAASGGLVLDVQFDQTTSKPDGTVLSQAPPAGSSVLPGDQVFLLVAKPGPTVLVPDLHGVAEADAVNQLLDADLKPGTRSGAFDSAVPAGDLLGTDPAAGVEIDRGGTVAYVVSLGVEPSATAGPTPVPTAATVAIPDIRDMDEATGFNTLLDADLLPGVRTEAFDPDIAVGNVISTDPAAGVEVERGTEVAYVVSLGVEPTLTSEPTVEPTPTPSPTPAPVAVPDLTGVAEADALNQLLDADLQPGTRTDAFDGAIPTGAVIGTDPAAGTEVEHGTTIDYVVSLGVEPTPTPSPTPAPVAVPDLTGVAEADALNQLLDADLQPGTRTDAFDGAIPTGAVIGTDPAAGTEVEHGTTIDYVVSLGVEPTPTPSPTPAPVAVPDLTGVAEADALNQLLDADLQPGTRTDAFDGAIPTGAVIGTDPAAGTEVEHGTTIDYVVSLGVEPTPTPSPTPAPVAVPDLTGVAEADALNQLLDADLQPGTRTDAFDGAIPTGAVIGTDPAAGTEVEHGTTIDYVVSLGVEPTPTPSPTPAPVAVPDLTGVAEADALNQLLDADLQPGTRTDAFDGAIPTGAVIGTDPAAGTEVEHGTTIDYVVSLGVEPTPTPSPTPAPVAVPDLTGVAEADALNQLLDADLQPGTRTDAFDGAIPTGAVIGTDPAAGTEVEHGTTIDYVVSLGVEPTPTPSPTPAPVAVPDLTGVAEADALNQLLDADLQPGTRTDAFDGAIPTGAVIGTDPAAGTEVEHGTTIDYVVSLGVEPTPTPSPTPAPVAVPDLTGVAEADALNQLLDADLQPGTRTDAFDGAIPTGAVIGTDPAAGTEVEHGTTIDYVVSLGVEPTPTPSPTPAPVAVPDLTGVAEADALNQLLDADLQPGTRTDAFDGAIPTGAVIGTDPAAGTEVEHGTTIDYVVSLGVEPTPTPSPTPAPVAVPDLTGVAEADALNQLLDADLQPGTRTDAFDGAIPTGAVIGTDPAAGTEVEHGTTIDYVVSLGVEPTPTPSPTPAPVAVPDLTGVAEADALNQLLDADLQPGTRTDAFDGAIPTGAVIGTDPAAGTEVEHGTTIDYVVSLGVEPTPTPSPTPAPVAVPDLRGFTPEDAVNALMDSGLQPGTRTDKFNSQVDAGLVIRTDPAAGTEVEHGTTIDYLVSLGAAPTPTLEPTPAPVAVPDVRGFTPDDAVNAILDAGLQPGERTDKFNAQVPDGQVIRTIPEAGTQVEPGSGVDYVVSRGAKPSPTPEPTPEPTAEPTPATVLIPDVRGFAEADAMNTLLDVGLQPGARTEAFDPEVAVDLVVSTDPAAGTEVASGAAIDYVVSLGVEPTTEPTPTLVAVPNLRGFTPEDAVNALVDAGLQPGERQDRFNANVPAGQVIRTVPEAGTEVALGTTVDYRVSLGAEATAEPTPAPTPVTVEVPNLRGSTPDDAVSALLDAGLQPGARHDRVNDNVPLGQVIRTDPAAGSVVDPGTTVDYFVSTAPDATPEPTAQPTSQPTSEPTKPPSNRSGIDPAVQAAIDEVVAQVPALRELDPKQAVPYREITQKQFKKQVTQSFDADNPPEQIAAEETLLKRLGLLPQDADLRQMMLDLYESQVAAFYDPKTGKMTVVKRDGDFGPEDRLFVAHEYDHALQDQYWNLQQVTKVSPSQGDRALARLALIEGDATTLMLQWAAQNLGPDDLARVTSAMTPAQQQLLDGMPPILRRQLEFPYLEGQVFVSTLLGQGGWSSVNAAWDKLPASTEQIMHPERYPSDAPVKVSLPDVAAALGDGWSASSTQTMGELDISVLLADGGDPTATAAAADGWGGDRLVSLDGPDGAWAVVWQTAWDSGSDADEFSPAVDAAMSDLEGAHAVLPGADIAGGLDNPVLVVVASSSDTLQQVEGALGVGN